MPSRSSDRPLRWRPVALVAGAVVVAYAAGVVTGALGADGPGTPDAAAAAPASADATGGEGTGSVLDAAADRIASQAARPVDRAVLERAAVEGMLRALGDRWSQYYAPSDYDAFRESVEGRYSGIGVWLRTAAPGSSSSSDVVVASVQPGSAAAKAGVLAGDEVVQVDGTDVRTEPVGTVAAALRGSAGTVVELVLRRDGSPVSVPVERATVSGIDVTVMRLSGGTDVVRVAAFSQGVGKQVRDALAADPGERTGVVLDLRGNPGGLLTEAVEVASAFLDGGTVVSYDKRGEPTHVLEALGTGDTTTPLVVLVDSGTASAAEVTAAALQDRNRAVVVGSRTFGKGSVQEPSTLPDGSALELTVGRYRTASGRLIDGVGVDPDVVVASSTSPTKAEQRALEVLRGLVVAVGGRG